MVRLMQSNWLLASLLSTPIWAVAAPYLEGGLSCSVQVPQVFSTPLGFYDSCTYAPIQSLTNLTAYDARLVYGTQDALGAYAAARSFSSVNATFGSLQVYAATELRMNGYGNATSQSQAASRFSDTIKITSQSLSAGSPVALQLRYELGFNNISSLESTSNSSGEFFYDLVAGFSIGANFAFKNYNNSWNSSTGSVVYQGSTFVEDNPFASGPDLIYTEVLQVAVGDEIDISAHLRTRSSAVGDLPFASLSSYLGYAESYANSSNGQGASLFLTPIDSQIELRSASGHNYGFIAEVPEPSQAHLLAIGLLTVVLVSAAKSVARFSNELSSVVA